MASKVTDSERHNTDKCKINHYCLESYKRQNCRAYFVYSHTFFYKIQTALIEPLLLVACVAGDLVCVSS